MGEFELIRRYFWQQEKALPASVALGIGDDCALLATTPGHRIAVSTDLLVQGVHFLPETDPARLGWKTLAVNLSDLAAMGARPIAFTLGLALTDPQDAWLAAFAHGLFRCARQFDCALVGGDTTRGPLTLAVTIFGELSAGSVSYRDRAQVGDSIWVSGSLGAAAFGLDIARGKVLCEDPRRQDALDALEIPTPRIELGLAVRSAIHAAIDVSDGLSADLGHLLTASHVGALIQTDALPIAESLRGESRSRALGYALAGGDDYELCFTAPASVDGQIAELASRVGCPVTRVGSIVAGAGVMYRSEGDCDGPFMTGLSLQGFDHFGQTRAP